MFSLSTLIAVFLADRVGRRPLLISGGVVMAVAQVVMAGVLGKLFMHGSTKLPPAVCDGEGERGGPSLAFGLG